MREANAHSIQFFWRWNVILDESCLLKISRTLSHYAGGYWRLWWWIVGNSNTRSKLRSIASRDDFYANIDEHLISLKNGEQFSVFEQLRTSQSILLLD